MTKAMPKSHIPYNSIYIILLKRQNYRAGKQISGCQGIEIVGEGSVTIKGQHERALCGDGTVLCLDYNSGCWN